MDYIGGMVLAKLAGNELFSGSSGHAHLSDVRDSTLYLLAVYPGIITRIMPFSISLTATQSNYSGTSE